MHWGYAVDTRIARDASAADFGRALKGFGINLLVRDIGRTVAFLKDVLTMQVHRADADFAVLEFNGEFFQLHADHTYHDNPLPTVVKESEIRGGGVELRLYGLDPDACETRARAANHMVLRTSLDRPHGLRECYLLDPDGYCWVPSTATDISKEK
ncbi:MAG: glyoxalase [Acidiferrobacteraceae bacterium]|jgi:catechol 2,3-dioxygenase-like lactoylglutathione lyase family enzyme|nr:glyoxalase [Acidiferrobacteraceae bacterium]|tara:strand:+ start:775 stop:1239 length:465 start_codon:yes stop_codon:yes gene_type:complete